MIDLAVEMAKTPSLPRKFRGNVGNCLAVFDVALRFDLNPYTLAHDPRWRKLK